MESYWFFDQLLDVLISGEQTGGAYSLLETFGPKDCMTPLHRHPRHDEAWSVSEGELTVWIGDDVHVLAPGDSVFAPRGVPHTFKSTGPAGVRMHVVCTPAGFERMFKRLAGTPVLIIGTHFAGATAGRLVVDGGGYRLDVEG